MKSSSSTGTSNLGQSSSKILLASERIQSHAGSNSNLPYKSGVNRQLRHRTRHTHAEIWKWTLTQHAIAPCRVEDIYAMQACDSERKSVLALKYVHLTSDSRIYSRLRPRLLLARICALSMYPVLWYGRGRTSIRTASRVHRLVISL